MTKKRLYAALVTGFGYASSTLSSSLPGGASSYIADHFHIKNQELVVLPLVIYLVGYIFGPLLLSPLSEHYGRKPTLNTANLVFFGASIGCALAPTFSVLVVFRFFAGLSAAVPLTVVGGVYADLFKDSASRGKATALYTIIGSLPTVCGPTLFAFVSIPSFRWSFWLTSMLSGLLGIALLFLPETYLPKLEKMRAQQLRCGKDCANSFAQIELDGRTSTAILGAALSRPSRMFFGEAVVFFSSLYASLIYAILFLLFAAYPYIFHGIYGMSYSISGLAFLPMGLGVLLSYYVIFLWDSYYVRNLPTASERQCNAEYRRLPLACAGGILQVFSLFWLAWTSSSSIHWIVPMLSGIIFGIALMLIMVSIFNYLTDSYGIYSASALGAASCVRSMCGACLPLAAHSMYSNLGVAWATSILGFAAVAMIPIPFVLIIYGEAIRARSEFCVKVHPHDDIFYRKSRNSFSDGSLDVLQEKKYYLDEE
ncbi:MFS transporter [Lachnellula subtilissima]|uniref:MFS transporter n=1 Tax=Lachnellula subtilissima TaxID=602034 RepID=A0A8H8S4X9_9HELO|nr:MFS transporter [Lachnellula subtilissima]